MVLQKEKNMNAIINGYGYALPPQVIYNRDLVGRINTTEDFIVTRTGVLTRRHVRPEEAVSSLMVEACQKAIGRAGLLPSEIDMLIVNTLSPDHHDPSQACLIQSMLGLEKIPAFDIRAQCTGLLYAMSIAEQFIAGGKYRNILICCGEVLSKRMDCSDDGRNLAILLGDGAGALILSPARKDAGILDTIIRADGEYYKLLWTASPGSAAERFAGDDSSCSHFRMSGKQMFEHAVESFTSIARELLSKHCLTWEDIEIMIPHQPNMRILDTVIENLSLAREKVWINVDRYGNMASASLPVALSEYLEQVDPSHLSGKYMLLVGYGSGATWGASLYKF